MTSRGSTNNGDRYAFPNGSFIPTSSNNKSGYTNISKVKILTDGVATLTDGNLTGINNLVANSIEANSITGNTSLNPSTALITDSLNHLASSNTTSTELSYVHGVTSGIQTQLNSKPNISNILGTSNQIVSTESGSDVIISIANNAELPGSGSITLPQGSVAQRMGLPGSMRFNTDSSIFESTSNGTTWDTIETSGTGVVSVSGTFGFITVSPTTGNCIIDISSSYIGQSSINTLGTISTGIWNGTLISPTYGGTGINNGTSTITLGGNLITAGTFASTFNITGITNVTFPISGTLSTTTGTVTGVSGTTNRITSTGGVSPIIDISASYIGQSSITTLGTISTGVWNGTLISPTYGGTGVNNGTSTITLGGNLITAGAFASTFNLTGITNVTFPTSGTLSTTSGTVTGVSGTTNRITSTGGVSPIIDISASYIGQSSITTLGTISTGIWNGTLISPTYGGTGVNNGTSTITLGGNLITAGAFASTFNITGITNVTFPTSGTLSTTSGTVTGVTATAPITSTGGTNPVIGLSAPLAIIYGGTAKSTVTIAPTATSWAGWDTSSNLSANNFVKGYATTATASTTTTLVTGSAYQQYFTGSLSQTVVMPVTSTLVLGQAWDIVNNSTQSVTLQSSGLNTIIVLLTGTQAVITCILTTGTTAASWSYTDTNITTGNLTNSGIINNTSTGDNNLSVNYLVLAGGGGGGVCPTGSYSSGGGGAGGLLIGSMNLSGANTITIGTGGASSNTTGSVGNNGGNTSFGSIISIGGGGGGGSTSVSVFNGLSGGSGGGGATGSSFTTSIGGTGTSGQGTSGGNGGSSGGGGGGGGAGSAGLNPVGGNGGNGGNGISSSISGSVLIYGGGGGGDIYGVGTGGTGGTGGGGNGSGSGGGNLNATFYGGGGGGGVTGIPSGSGGSGIVIISYTSATQIATGGTVTTSGGNFIHTFTSSGTFSISAAIITTGGASIAKSLVIGTSLSSVSGTFIASGTFQTLYTPNIPSSNIVTLSDGAGTTCGMFNVLVLASGVGQVVGSPSINLNWQFSGSALQFQTINAATPTLTWSAIRFF